MGQKASAAGQAGQTGTTPAGLPEDAFRHFNLKDDKGAASYNSRPQEGNSNYSNHDMSSAPPARSSAGGSSSCFYVDTTRPNGPMDRASPMDCERREFGRESFGRLGSMETRPNNGPTSTNNLNQTPVVQKIVMAEASTMMSTGFLRSNNNYPQDEGGIVQYKISTVNEECQVESSSRFADGPQDFDHAGSNDQEVQHRNAGGMVTYDEVPSQDQYGGMTTCDEPIMGLPNYQQQHKQQPSQKKKAPPPPMQQAPPPVVSQQDSLSGSGFSQAWTSVSQRQQQAPSSVATASFAGQSAAGSAAPVKPMNVMDELNQRKAWDVGSVLEVFSSSVGKWYIAQIAQVGEGATAHMITVQFIGDNGQIMQKSMPRSDVQLATFGRNTRQMPPGFQKVASESRPGQFSYQDSSTGTKYQTKDLAWQNYYANILKTEQAQQLLKQQSLKPQTAEQTAAEKFAAERLMPAPLQPPPTMSLAPSAPVSSQGRDGLSADLYAGAYGPDPVLAQSLQPAPVSTAVYSVNGGAGSVATPMPQVAERASFSIPATVGDMRSLQTLPPSQQKPQTMGDLSSISQPQTQNSKLPSSKTPFPGYGMSFAVGTNAGYEAYLASQGLN